MDRVLGSWKEIANYMGKGVRTVQRWEKTLGLPIHRPGGSDHNVVVANTKELSEWMMSGKQQRRRNGIKTILLVDDDANLRFVTRALLEEMGYIVLICADAERATYVFENGPTVDLLLSDVQLPGISGIELAKRLTANNPALPVVLTSGVTPDEEGMREIARRGWTFLAKLVGTPDLLSAVVSALGTDSDGSAANVPAKRISIVLHHVIAGGVNVPARQPRDRWAFQDGKGRLAA